MKTRRITYWHLGFLFVPSLAAAATFEGFTPQEIAKAEQCISRQELSGEHVTFSKKAVTLDFDKSRYSLPQRGIDSSGRAVSFSGSPLIGNDEGKPAFTDKLTSSLQFLGTCTGTKEGVMVSLTSSSGTYTVSGSNHLFTTPAGKKLRVYSHHLFGSPYYQVRVIDAVRDMSDKPATETDLSFLYRFWHINR